MTFEPPTGWASTTVADIADSAPRSIAIGPFGSSLKSDKYTEDGVPVVRGTNIGDGLRLVGSWVHVSPQTAASLPGAALRRGDLFFPHRGAIGQVGLITADEPLIMSTSLMKLTCDTSRADPLFVFYYFRSTIGRSALLAYSSTVGTPGIGRPLTSLRAIRLGLPPLKEQRRIVRVLTALENKIESNRKAGAVAETLATRLFRRGLFELDSSAAPETWERAPINSFVGLNPTVRLARGTAAPFIEMAKCEPFGTRPVEIGEREAAGGAKFEPLDTLFARITPCTENGKGAFVDFLDEPGTGSTEFIVLRAGHCLTPEAVWLLSRSRKFRAHAIRAMTGSSGRQRVPMNCFDAFEIAVPPHLDTWAGLADQISGALSVGLAGWRENSRLVAVRDALLPQLISGRLRVPDTLDAEEVLQSTAEVMQTGR